MNSPSSASHIQEFINFHNLNVEEIADDLSSFKNFNEFFYRKLKKGARAIAEPSNPVVFFFISSSTFFLFQLKTNHLNSRALQFLLLILAFMFTNLLVTLLRFGLKETLSTFTLSFKMIA